MLKIKFRGVETCGFEILKFWWNAIRFIMKRVRWKIGGKDISKLIFVNRNGRDEICIGGRRIFVWRKINGGWVQFFCFMSNDLGVKTTRKTQLPNEWRWDTYGYNKIHPLSWHNGLYIKDVLSVSLSCGLRAIPVSNFHSTNLSAWTSSPASINSTPSFLWFCINTKPC